MRDLRAMVSLGVARALAADLEYDDDQRKRHEGGEPKLVAQDKFDDIRNPDIHSVLHVWRSTGPEAATVTLLAPVAGV